MHWTDDELKALYQLAAVQPRDWPRIAEALRQLYPDRRLYTIGSIQQKYNEAVRCPAWDDGECAALLKYGKQFPGQWDRIAALMKMTFGDKRRSYIGEILERKWKRLRRDANVDSEVDSECTDPNLANGALTKCASLMIDAGQHASAAVVPVVQTIVADGADGNSTPLAPPFSAVAVPIWPVNNPVPPEAVSNTKQIETPNPAPEATEAAVTADPVKTEHDVTPAAEPGPVTADAVKPDPDLYDDNFDGFRFNPEEAAEILADFGCQFVSELELALSRSGSVSLQQDAAPNSPCRNDLELSVVAKLADQRDRVRHEYSEPEDGEIHESVESASQSAMKPTEQPVQNPDSEQPAPDLKQSPAASNPDPSQSARDCNVPDVPFPQAKVVPAPNEHSSDNDVADDDSKAPISRRIQRRRKSTSGTGREESDHAPIRSRKRSKSLDHDKPVAQPRKQSARRLSDESPPELKKPRRLRDDGTELMRRRRKDSAESELSRRRPKPGRKRKKDEQDAHSSDSERVASPFRSRRFSDSEPRKARRQKPTPVAEPRKLTVWTEEEERLLATLRRQYGSDWEKIGSALQAEFPDLRPYTVVSVRCKWNYMCRHEHPLAFDSDEDEEEEAAPTADEKVAEPQSDVEPPKVEPMAVKTSEPKAVKVSEPKAVEASEPKAVKALEPKADIAEPKINVPMSADSDDNALCDVDDTGSISDVGAGAFDIADHDVLRTLLRDKADWDGETSVRDRRNTNSNKDRSDSDAEDLAICDI